MASIKKRDNGKWRARYRDDQGREHARHFDRKSDAQQWINEVNVARTTGRYITPNAGATTLAAFFDDWRKRQVWADGTAQAAGVAMRSCTFADVRLRDIRPSHVEHWVKSMDANGLAASTIKTRVNNVRAVLRGAIRDRQIADDPTAGVPLPRQRKSEAAMRIPTPAEVGALLRAAEPWFAPFIAVCAFAGLRHGEANGLQGDDIEFLQRRIQVHRQVQRDVKTNRAMILPPKYGSERVVHAPQELLEILSGHIADVGLYGDDGWVFPGRDGDPMLHAPAGRYWRKTTEKAGLQGLRIHDLRHFYASGLIADGCDVVTVQRALGHAKATTTLGIYAHVWPTAEDRTRAAASRLMRQALTDESSSDAVTA